MVFRCAVLVLLNFALWGCAGMMPPEYIPVTDGPVAEVTFSGPDGSMTLPTGKTVDVSGSAEFDLYRCRTLTWDNMHGYFIVGGKHDRRREHTKTVTVRADEPVMMRVTVDIGSGLTGTDLDLLLRTIRFEEMQFISFVPVADERYFVGFTFVGESGWFPLDKRGGFAVYVQRIDRQNGERELVPVTVHDHTGSGFRFSPQVVAEWPECR